MRVLIGLGAILVTIIIVHATNKLFIWLAYLRCEKYREANELIQDELDEEYDRIDEDARKRMQAIDEMDEFTIDGKKIN